MTVTTAEKRDQANEAEQRLLESALILFSQKGYKGTSIREIIEAAGVTRPVLYYYFENKESLYCRLVEHCFLRMRDEIGALFVGVKSCRERLTLLIRHAFEGAEAQPEVVRLLLQVFFGPVDEAPQLDKSRLWRTRFDHIESVMREGVAGGELAPASPETLAMAFCGMMDMYILLKFHCPETRLSRELGDRLIRVFFDGAGSNGGPAGPGSGSAVPPLSGEWGTA